MSHFNFQNAQPNPYFKNVLDVPPSEVNQNKDQLCIVDVRRDEEYNGELGHIPNSRHIILDDLESELANLPQNKTIVFVCRSGARSAQATYWAQEFGIKYSYNLFGGMLLWNEENLECTRT